MYLATMNPNELPQYWINHLSFLIRKTLVAAFERAGFQISAEEWAVLLIVSARRGITPGAVSEASLCDKTMVDRLVRRGFVERSRDDQDRRVVRLALTDEGQAVFAQLSQVARQVIDASQAGLSAQELRATVAVLERMTANLASKGDDGNGL